MLHALRLQADSSRPQLRHDVLPRISDYRAPCRSQSPIHPSVALILFGLFSMLFTVSEYAGVMVLRVLLGLAEAFVNNAFIYVSLWYKPNELALRTAAIYSMTPVAGAVSGLLAYAVGSDLKNAHGIATWKWLFIIEGSATMGFGFIVLFLLPGLPERVASKGTFLIKRAEERGLIMQRLKAGE